MSTRRIRDKDKTVQDLLAAARHPGGSAIGQIWYNSGKLIAGGLDYPGFGEVAGRKKIDIHGFPTKPFKLIFAGRRAFFWLASRIRFAIDDIGIQLTKE